MNSRSIRAFLCLLSAGVLMVPLLEAPVVASTGGITAYVGGGVSSAPHVAGAGDWTFDLIGITGNIRKMTVAVRLESCTGLVHDYVEASRPSVGARFTIANVPQGRHCARVSAEGTSGSTARYIVDHPAPPAAGSVLILRPARQQPFTLGSPNSPLWVSAVVVGTGEDWDASTSRLDWYDCFDGTCTLAAADKPEGYISLAAGAHTLVASLSSPGTGTQATYDVIVREEVTVVLGPASFSGSSVTIPVSVTDHGAGVEGRVEADVMNQAGEYVASPHAETDATGNATLTFRLTQRGTYQIEVFAYGRQFEYGHATGTFTK